MHPLQNRAWLIVPHGEHNVQKNILAWLKLILAHPVPQCPCHWNPSFCEAERVEAMPAMLDREDEDEIEVGKVIRNENGNKDQVEEKKKAKKKKKKNKSKQGEDADEGDEEADPETKEAEKPEGKEEDDGGSPDKASKKKKKPADGYPQAEEGQNEEEEGEDEDGETAGTTTKKKKKKKKKGGGQKVFNTPEQDNSSLRRVKNWAAQTQWRQSPAFDIPVSEQFPDNQFPFGECVEYLGSNAFRTTSAEKRELERLASYDYEKIRKAGEVHRQVRRYVQSYVKPGMKMTEICQRLERKTHELVVANGLEAGWGFPTGCSLNWVAAHYTPNYGDETVLQFDDVCKLDFGVQVGGRIVDCAFTIAFNERYDPIIEATQAGTNTGVKEAGIDARFSEIGASIQETIESYEIELNGRLSPSSQCGTWMVILLNLIKSMEVNLCQSQRTRKQPLWKRANSMLLRPLHQMAKLTS